MFVNSQHHLGTSSTQADTLELIKLTQAYFTPALEKKNPPNYRGDSGAGVYQFNMHARSVEELLMDSVHHA